MPTNMVAIGEIILVSKYAMEFLLRIDAGCRERHHSSKEKLANRITFGGVSFVV